MPGNQEGYKTQRRTPKPGSSLTKIRCKRDGCKRKITFMALRQGDPFCSKDCYMADHAPRELE